MFEAIFSGGILAILSVIVFLFYWVITAIASWHIHKTALDMCKSDIPEVAAAGQSMNAMSLVSFILAILGFGIVSLILNLIMAPKTDPSIYPTGSENGLSDEEIANLTPIERARARREGLISNGTPVDIKDARQDICFKASWISIVVWLALIAVSMVSCAAGVGSIAGNLVDTNDASVLFEDGTWEENPEDGSIIMTYPDDIFTDTGDGTSGTILL